MKKMTVKINYKMNYQESDFQEDFQDILFTNTKYMIHIRTQGSPIDNYISPKDDPFHILSLAELKVENPLGLVYLRKSQVEASRDSIFQKRFLLICARNDNKTYIILNYDVIKLLLRRDKRGYKINLKWLDYLDSESNKILDQQYYNDKRRLQELREEGKVIFLESLTNLGKELSNILGKIISRNNPLI